MKIGFCAAAFVIGCIMSVLMTSSANSHAVSDAITELKSLRQAEPTSPTILPTISNPMTVDTQPYGSTQSGQELTRFVCTNANGYSIEMVDYGATVVTIRMPDRNGELDNVVLSCNDIDGYEACTCYFGSTVGRVCNRIAGGKFAIDGVEYSLAVNNGPNHLHGGLVGFDKKVWQGEAIKEDGIVGVRFTLTSDNGDEGYPGQLSVVAEYRLNNDNELSIQFEATTDATTHVNLTNHSYWNLAGATSGKIYDHLVQINADHYLPVDDTSIPTGGLATVAGTPFDFTSPKPIGRDMQSLDSDPNGYDHNYVINEPDAGLRLAAVVTEPKSGRTMEVLTTQPGVQFYTGNYLAGQPSTGGFDIHSGFCLETQSYPNAANQPTFPSTLLKPGETYRQLTVHRFRVD